MHKENTLMNRTLTRRIAFCEQFDLFVGIDLGKKKNVAVMMDRRCRQYGRLKFAHNRADYEKLVDWLRKERAGLTQPRILVGMEPTNDYWQWLAAYLEQQEIPYRLVNAFTVKKSREGNQLDYAKDDNRDALTISHLLTQGQFTETQLLPAPYAQMRQYEQAHWRLRREIGQQKTLLRQQVERLFPELSQVFGDLSGKTASALLVSHADPQRIASMSLSALVAGVRQDFTGQRLMVKKLQEVYELAPVSIGLQPSCALQLLIRQQQNKISSLQQQLAEVEKELLACLHTLPTAPSLLSLGLGEVTTAVIMAELGDLSRFSSAKQLVKLAGIQPTSKQSGQYNRESTPMSHKGRARLRTYLFFATMRLIRWDSAFRARQQALISRPSRPLKKLAAVGVLMNKLLHLIWAVHRKKTNYSPQLFTLA
jgi:transposase